MGRLTFDTQTSTSLLVPSRCLLGVAEITTFYSTSWILSSRKSSPFFCQKDFRDLKVLKTITFLDCLPSLLQILCFPFSLRFRGCNSMARKKIREYDSKRLLKEHLKRLANIDLQIRSAQVTLANFKLCSL